MHQFLRFPEDRILREQVALIRRNDPVSLFGVVAAATIASLVIYMETNTRLVLHWLMFVIAVTLVWSVAQNLFGPLPVRSPRFEGTVRVAMAIIYSLVWGWMILTFLPQATPLTMVAITMISGIVVAGSVATQSACLPLCLGFVMPNLLAAMVALIFRGQFVDLVLATGAVMYLAAVVLCAVTMENTVRDSIVLRFDNEELIDKLREALDKTEEATEAKSMFLASASHDLRQPIQAMSLVTEAIKDTDLTDYQQTLSGHLEAAVDSTRRMLDSLLDFSKVDAGVVTAVVAPFSVRSIFSRLESELAPLANEKKLAYRCRQTDALASSDKQIVEMILRNLITNAIRYTNEGGILVVCRERKKELTLVFEVWDTGIGVSTEDQKAIFKEFRQIGNPERDSQKGFGLGLAISQGLAETIKSEISVFSRPGKGSVFRFSVPESSVTIIKDEPEFCAMANFSGRSILVIDDNERIRVSMRTLIESWGCHCFAAESTEVALQHAVHREPDLMLVDYRLQDNKTGSQAIDDIRTFFDKSIPAIIITGDTAVDRLYEVAGAPAAFMHKPVSASALKRMISSHMPKEDA